jgi:hypothetical protein
VVDARRSSSSMVLHKDRLRSEFERGSQKSPRFCEPRCQRSSFQPPES